MENDRQKSIDGWRCFFCYVIIFYHFYSCANGIFIGGYLAVDFFFILSGFMWMKSMKKEKYHNSIDLICKKVARFFPSVLYMLVIVTVLNSACSNRSLSEIVKEIVHIIYESTMLYCIGISSEYYIATYVWYIATLIIALAILTELKFVFKERFTSLVLFLIIIFAYSHLFGTYTDFKDFRAIANGDFLIKGMWRGLADCAVGALLSFYLSNVIEFINKLRSWIVVLFELGTLALLYLIIMYNDKIPDTDILIVPISIVIISLCYAKRGIMERILGLRIFSLLGKIAYEIYITQSISMELMITFIPKVLKYDLSKFNFVIVISWVCITILIALLFKISLKYLLKLSNIILFKKQKEKLCQRKQ